MLYSHSAWASPSSSEWAVGRGDDRQVSWESRDESLYWLAVAENEQTIRERDALNLLLHSNSAEKYL